MNREEYNLLDKVVVHFVGISTVVILVIASVAGCQDKKSREYATDERNYTYEVRHDSCECCSKQYIREQVDSILTEIFD